MNYNVRELVLAGDLIYDTLTRLNLMGMVDVDLASVNFSSSAFRALEREYLEGPEEEDNTDEGLMKKGIRFITSAVYLDGSPVMNADNPIEIEDVTDDGEDSFAFWNDEDGTDNAGFGKKQVVHSDLMITNIDQIRLHTQFLEYRNGKPRRRILVEGLDGVLICYIDLANWSRGVLTAKDYGILPLERGRWNVTNWLEPIETMAASE